MLDGRQRQAVDANYVRDHYLQSFAILLCIGQGHLIRQFQKEDALQDQKLPHRTQPSDFPSTDPGVFEEFQAKQWQFCAPTLKYGMDAHFKDDDILPILRREQIGEGGSAIVYKIVLDDEYNALSPRSLDKPV